MEENFRLKQVGEKIKNELGPVLNRHCHNANIPMATITRIQISPDLYYAYVWVSFFDKDLSEKKKERLKQLQKITPQIKKEFGKQIGDSIKRVPRLDFRVDETWSHIDRVEELIQKIHDKEENA